MALLISTAATEESTPPLRPNITWSFPIFFFSSATVESIKVSEAQDIAVKALDKIGEENLKYYDVQFILTYSGTDENSNFPVFGSKSSSSLKVVW